METLQQESSSSVVISAESPSTHSRRWCVPETPQMQGGRALRGTKSAGRGKRRSTGPRKKGPGPPWPSRAATLGAKAGSARSLEYPLQIQSGPPHARAHKKHKHTHARAGAARPESPPTRPNRNAHRNPAGWFAALLTWCIKWVSRGGAAAQGWAPHLFALTGACRRWRHARPQGGSRRGGGARRRGCHASIMHTRGRRGEARAPPALSARFIFSVAACGRPRSRKVLAGLFDTGARKLCRRGQPSRAARRAAGALAHGRQRAPAGAAGGRARARGPAKAWGCAQSAKEGHSQCSPPPPCALSPQQLDTAASGRTRTKGPLLHTSFSGPPPWHVVFCSDDRDAHNTKPNKSVGG